MGEVYFSLLTFIKIFNRNKREKILYCYESASSFLVTPVKAQQLYNKQSRKPVFLIIIILGSPNNVLHFIVCM